VLSLDKLRRIPLLKNSSSTPKLPRQNRTGRNDSFYSSLPDSHCSPIMELEPSFVQTINGKPMQFYRMGGKRTNPNSMEHLVPYMVPTTYAVLCLLLLQLGRKTWPYYATDLATSLACAALHRFKQPLLSINLAIGYTIWNLIPGSLAAKDLPSHSEFMQNLKIKEPADSPMECAICWDDDQSTAELPMRPQILCSLHQAHDRRREVSNHLPNMPQGAVQHRRAVADSRLQRQLHLLCALFLTRSPPFRARV
jgi:hypothetical protein